MQNFPPLFGQIRHLAAKRGQCTLNSMPVVVPDLPSDGAILFQADVPTLPARRTDRVMPHVVCSLKPNRKHVMSSDDGSGDLGSPGR